MALRLTVPSSVSSQNPPAETRPKQLKEWLDSLPLSKLFESSRAVCDELARLNRLRISADERLRLLEIYAPVLQQLRLEIAEDYNKAPLPLPSTSRQAVNLSRELLIEEAYAYKLALLEKMNKLKLFGVRKQLEPLIERVMLILSSSLTLSYQSYLPTPAGIWHEMHELYRYAYLQKMVGEETNGAGVSSIDRIYKHAVLIALADPYRLSRTDLHDVMRVATQVAPLTKLHLMQLPDTQSLFVILPDTDKPPKPALPSGLDAEQRGVEWIVDTIILLRRLADVLAERQSGSKRLSGRDVLHAAPEELLRRLIQCWGAPHKRLLPRRQAGQATVHICMGISRLCKLLDSKHGEGSLNLPLRSQAGAVWEWDVVNQSAVGVKLRGTPSGDVAINVGEIVGVQHRGIPEVAIGVVRWAQTFEDASVEFGVQMLGPRAEVVTLEPTIGSNELQRALLLPEIQALQQPAAILMRPGWYMLGREFVLTNANQITTIRAGALVAKTSCYELFYFLPA
ncbi:MAG TPA: hypothetical protein VM532_13140 [Burkholderiales bacterium]|nr:hypothetical protein [Burkholderiales bacterium]